MYWGLETETITHFDSDAYIEYALRTVHRLIYDLYEEHSEVVKARESMKITMYTQTYGKNVHNVCEFIRLHYPSIKVTVVTHDRIRYIRLIGNHLAVNAWWWATLYSHLQRHYLGEGLKELIQVSSTSVCHWGTKEDLTRALNRLIAGQEPGMYKTGFYTSLQEI